MKFEDYIENTTIATPETKKQYVDVYYNRGNHVGRFVETVQNYSICFENFKTKVQEKSSSCEFTFMEYLMHCTLLKLPTINTYSWMYSNPARRDETKLVRHIKGYEYCKKLISEKKPSQKKEPKKILSLETKTKESGLLGDLEDVLTCNLRDDLKVHLLKLIVGNSDE